VLPSLLSPLPQLAAAISSVADKVQAVIKRLIVIVIYGLLIQFVVVAQLPCRDCRGGVPDFLSRNAPFSVE
jgi:hypothetical protein